MIRRLVQCLKHTSQIHRGTIIRTFDTSRGLMNGDRGALYLEPGSTSASLINLIGVHGSHLLPTSSTDAPGSL